MLRKLKIPFELSCVGIKCEQAIAVEIVAGAPLAPIRGRRIARGPKSSIGRRIVSPRDPRRRPSDFPRVAFPTVVAGLPGTRNRVEPPLPFAGGGIVRVDKSSNPIFPATHP